MKKPIMLSDEVVHLQTVENLVGTTSMDIVLYRFRSLKISKSSDVGIDIDGSQSEVISLYHYVVGSNYYVTQRIREQEKEKRERKDKKKGGDKLSLRGSNLDVHIRLPEDFNGSLNLLLCDGITDINVFGSSIELKAVTAQITMDKTGPLKIEAGDSDIYVNKASGKVHSLKAINSKITIAGGTISGLNVDVESIDKLKSEIHLDESLAITGKITMHQNGGKIFQGATEISRIDDFKKKVIRKK